MRFIPSNCLKPGQILGSDLIFDKHRVLLRQGVALTTPLINKIRLLGFQGIYVDDDLSRHLQIQTVVSDDLRYRAQSEVRSLFVTVETSKPYTVDSHIRAMNSMITNIVDEILANKNVMVNVIDIRAYDDYTYSHSINVAILSVVLGAVLGMDKHMLNDLAMGALMHDVGKLFVDKRIINKASKLTPEELEEARRHSLAGYNYLCSNNMIPEESKMAVLMHHEQYSGNGYPSGLAENDIHLFGRVVCVADVYDALVSDRPYRRAMLPSDAIEYIMSGYGSMFDPMIVDAFIKKVAAYPVGTTVRLSNGDIGIVVENYESACLRPKIKRIEGGQAVEEYIDLAHDTSKLNLTIQEIIDI